MTQCDGHCGAEPKRDRWKRPEIDGVPHPRVSTVAGALSDMNNLIDWQSRMLFRYATQPQAVADLEAMRLAIGDEVAEKQVHERAKNRAGLKDAALRGSNLHAAVALLARGLPLPHLDDNTMRSLRAFERTMARHNMVPTLSEQFVVNRGAVVAGTFDLVIESPDGVYMADVKTGAKQWERKYPHPVAIQLAAYQGGTRWCPEHGDLTPHGANPSVGYLISLPVDTDECHLTPIDLDAGRTGLSLALEVRSWRELKAKNLIRA